jgi:hypothetical protein
MLIEEIFEQLKNNSGKNLFYNNLEEVLDVNPTFLELIIRLKESPERDDYESVMDKLIDQTVNYLIKEIYDINQFINLSNEKISEVRKIYRDTWESIKQSNSIEKVLYLEHYPKLSLWLAETYPQNILEPMKNQKQINRIICKEYSPKFQLSILDLSLTSIKSPILDIGCGENANLVNYLRENSKSAFGIDRILNVENDYCKKISWFNFDFGKNKWGTIISNMALSNNFNYAAVYDNQLLEEYNKLYKKILESLIVGGTFVYAPSFSLFEKELDNVRFNKEHIHISAEFYLTRITKIL